MTETKKKEKAPTKPRKTAAKKPTVPTMNGKPANGAVPHEEVAKLAHRFWAERGQQPGRPEDDWFRAEHELLGKAS
jgi:hypothetical protein